MTVDAPKVCIVTPIHDGWAETRRYLSSVGELTYPNIETIVVDDGSTDGSSGRLKDEFPEVIVLSGDGNLWWAGATNIGASEAVARGARFIFTCNNDVVLDPEVISASVRCALSASKSLVGAMIFYAGEPGRVWFAGARLDRNSGDIAHDTAAWDAVEGPREVSVLTGMGMLIPTEAYEAVGGFDASHFPQYFADCDLSLRAAHLGYRLLVSPDSRIFNDVTSAWSVREFERGRLGFIPEMLYSKRSAFWVGGRIRFYRRHWGPGWQMALLRLYRGWARVYVLPILKRRVMLLLTRKDR